MFKLNSPYNPTGDQPVAIDKIIQGFQENKKKICLMGATGTGKTFTMANVITKLQRPTLVISHNKTLAAQLATEFKYFFPNNAVHYFVSYFDYYQPEAYLPERDIYIEKESSINQEIEMYRLSTLASLLSRQDVIVVSSVSALYGLGAKDVFASKMLYLEQGQEYNFKDLKSKLITMQYKPMQNKIEPGMFDMKGETIDIFSSTDKLIYRLIFNEDKLELIQKKDSLTYQVLENITKINIWPASQFLQNMSDLENIIQAIYQELEQEVHKFQQAGQILEAQRLQKKVSYDLRTVKETGYVNGIENYSVYFDKRQHGEPPNTLFDYFPDNLLVIIDESHMSLPQLRAMPQGDYSRKVNLINHGFRLPSAHDHRPINFGELDQILNWGFAEIINKKKKFAFEIEKVDPQLIKNKIKKNVNTLFVSATPAPLELIASDLLVEQIIRPTGLIDPLTYIYPKSGDYQYLLNSLEKLLDQKNNLLKYIIEDIN